MRRRLIPFPRSGSAYTEALYPEFERQGLDVTDGHWLLRWFLRHLRASDVVHINWPSFLYTSLYPLPLMRQSLRSALILLFVRLRGASLWWTAHNVMPHDRTLWPWLDTAFRHWVIRLASTIFVHGAGARDALVKAFPAAANKCVVIPHGHWIGFFPPPVERSVARRELGLSDGQKVFLCAGQCRRYKNIDGLVRAFRQVRRADATLLIVGAFKEPGYLEEVTALARQDPRVRLAPGYVTDEQMALYYGAADVSCVPYQEILTSGSAMMSLTYGRPFISIDRGFLRDIITPDCGVLVPNLATDTLAEAIEQTAQRTWDAEKIVARAREFTFTDAAAIMAHSLRDEAQRPGQPRPLPTPDAGRGPGQ